MGPVKQLAKLFLLVLVVGIGLAWAGLRYLEEWGQSPLDFNQDQVLEVASGSSFHRLAAQLEDQGLIEKAWMFRLYMRVHDKSPLLQAGEYQLNVGTNVNQLIELVQSGEVIEYSVTLVNGHTFKQFLASLAAHPKLIQTLQQQSPEQIMVRLQSAHQHPEGLFYPDTYHFHKGESDFDILARAYSRMQQLLNDAWQNKADGLPYESPYEALIMASIVEKETAVPSERGTIAGVFVNRLRKNMRLQTDPTVIYGLGDSYGGNITRAHLRDYTPYNTYRINGLPPTPIANPALPAIEASLHPEPTSALYFVAKGDGSHQFSQTLAQHQKAVRQYQLKRRTDYRSTPKK